MTLSRDEERNDQFLRLFGNGHGRAFLWHLEDPTLLDAETLYQACTHDRGFMEDRRDFYLGQFLDLRPDRDEILDRVWRRLVRTPVGGFWTDNQGVMRSLARRYAEGGDERAKKALYRRVEKNLAEGKADGVSDLLHADKESALSHLVRLFEGAIKYPDDPFRLSHDIEDAFGEEWRNDWARANAPSSETARMVLAEIDRVYEKPPPERPIRTYDDLLAMPIGERYAYKKLFNFLSHSSDAEFRKAAENLPSNDTDLANVLKWLFDYRDWPLDPRLLFNLTRSRSWKVKNAAYRALCRLKSPAVRKFALQRLPLRREGQRAVDLLVTNYEPGDERIIRERAEKSKDVDELHEFLMELLQIIEQHPEIDNEFLTFLYDHQPCSFCRYSVVKCLIDRNLFTVQHREECLRDAEEDTRKLADSF